MEKPRVSAVIPTRNRPELVCRAVRSVLAQTIRDIECIVVVDGPDPATIQALEVIGDPRLRVVTLTESAGGCEARNTGARASTGDWVALLDDDDEWLPERLSKQLAAAASSREAVTMVVCRFLDRGADGDLVRPNKFLREGQPISEFLWCQVSPFGGIEGFPQTSTWLIRREFFLETPFTKGLKCLQDLDWLLHAFANPRMRVLLVQEPLTIFHNDYSRQRVTKRIDWQYSFAWGMQNRHLFTRKAFGFFLVIYCVNPAAQQGANWTELVSLLKDCRRYGRISPKLLWLSFLYVFVYPLLSKTLSPRTRSTMLYRVRDLIRRLRPGKVGREGSAPRYEH
jgi:glycosyltransferase involved in cell wall biosynthesis